MKIFNNNHASFYPKATSIKNEDAKSPKVNKNKFDEILISGKNQNSEELFSKELSSKILTEIRIPTPKAELDSIKSQIAKGEYTIDVDQITKNILLNRKDI